ncbi:hypothetical protein FACS1894198_1810 [Clostridia bacterium]|nr:hypothetical protein FACS1894198_1810 [Clostridia bacterium]
MKCKKNLALFFCGIVMISNCAIVAGTPYNIKREFSEAELQTLSQELYLKAQNILEQEKKTRGSLKDLNVSNILEILHAHNRFGSVPTVVNHGEFEKLSQEKTVLYRGIFADNQSTLDKWIKQLKYGDCFYGSESAIFSTSSLAGAKGYAVPCRESDGKSGTGKVINFLLKDDAKIISEKALGQFIEKYKKEIIQMYVMTEMIAISKKLF